MSNNHKTILGLDLGTNSIGWSLISRNFHTNEGNILGLGVRIIPMTQDLKDEFGKGNSISQTADRTKFRGIRRLRERFLLRRERLHRVLHLLNFLPEHYAQQIDFKKKLGQFLPETEPKLAYKNNEFIFKTSFAEMLQEFEKYQPTFLSENGKVPYDWTIYYLRKKALTHKISKEELAWILLNFNQKRGYYQLRGEEEDEQDNKKVEYHSLKIVEVVADEEPNRKGDLWYSLHLENGWVYRRPSKTSLLDWKDKVRDFIVTTDLNSDGSPKLDKDGNVKRSFRAPSENDWGLKKKKSEQDIEASGMEVGHYIYSTLLANPQQKILGEFVQTIDRKLYKKEITAILNKQVELQPELFSEETYKAAIIELYKYNEAHRNFLMSKDFVHLLVEDILYYQRPLKSQKSNITKCSLEFRTYKTKDNQGNEIEKVAYINAIPKSHPLYQEFRIWQWLYNLRIYEHLNTDLDVTDQFINSVPQIEELFDFLNQQKEVDHKDVLKFLLGKKGFKGKELTNELQKYRWNYVYDKDKKESKKYPMNETGFEISRRIQKVHAVPEEFLDSEKIRSLWHIIYSVSDREEFKKALTKFAQKHGLEETSFVENFIKIPPYNSDYGTYSEKALKKLLPLMRIGKYWNWDDIDPMTQSRIDKIITGEYDEEIKNRVREKSIGLQKEEDFQGLQLWLAQYIVYNRHSESSLATKWRSVDDLENFLQEFKQHSLRNPIVEQVITETLRVVKDIWTHYGHGANNFFDEIHIELARDLKKNAKERSKLTKINSVNEATNQRIKLLLVELFENSDNRLPVEDVRPHSPMQQATLKIYEEAVLNSIPDIPDDIQKINNMAQPSLKELQRYKLWLDQKYRSPYTGKMIPLSKLFTHEYEIEHIIPQSRFFDDSFSNKILCEAEINRIKDKQLGLEFIQNHCGQKFTLSSGREVEIFSEENYLLFVKEQYAKNSKKRDKLLLLEIPDGMIERQMNDTRYISKYISTLLSNIVRSENNDDGVNSKNLISGTGGVTNVLKKDWGLHNIWNDLVIERFERLNQITGTSDFTAWNEKHQTFLPTVPLNNAKGFQLKRIDHRHHAMDALVVACATKDHINLMNNQSAKSERSRYDLQNKLRKKVEYFDTKQNRNRFAFREFYLPWDNFTLEAKQSLENIVVSFKSNLRVINKTTNKYESYKKENGELRLGNDGKPKKGLLSQTKGDSWAIRKSMHKDTVSGKIHLDKIKLPKGKFLTATRKNVDKNFNLKMIESITDTGIQKILKNYLKYKNDNPGQAFSQEGLEELNQNIEKFNEGKKHQPIKKVRIFELGSKFQVGQTGNKKDKYVEAAKGTNLFFGVYADAKGNRSFATIPFNLVMERQKQGLSSVPEKNEKGHNLLFTLSPNDLVYVPSEEEMTNEETINFSNLSKDQKRRIYKMVSCTGNRCFFIPQAIATSIVNKVEFSALNKIENTEEGISIKKICFKIAVDRIGRLK